MNTPTLHTRRLMLRKFNPDDIQALFLILKDEEANRFLPWYPAETVEEAKIFTRKDMRRNTICHRPMHTLSA